MTRRAGSLWLLVAIALLVLAFFGLGLHRYLNFDTLKAQQQELLAFRHARPLPTILLVALGYIVMALLPIPGAVLLTLLTGALFGLVAGVVLASFASSVGAALGFLLARHWLRLPLQRRYAERIGRIDAGIERDGAAYLFSLRLLPVLPFFLVNLLFGLSAMPLRRFWLVSQTAMLPGALVYTNAGRELAGLQRVSDVVSPSLLASFALMAALPWVARRLLRRGGAGLKEP